MPITRTSRRSSKTASPPRNSSNFYGPPLKAAPTSAPTSCPGHHSTPSHTVRVSRRPLRPKKQLHQMHQLQAAAPAVDQLCEPPLEAPAKAPTSCLAAGSDALSQSSSGTSANFVPSTTAGPALCTSPRRPQTSSCAAWARAISRQLFGSNPRKHWAPRNSLAEKRPRRRGPVLASTTVIQAPTGLARAAGQEGARSDQRLASAGTGSTEASAFPAPSFCAAPQQRTLTIE